MAGGTWTTQNKVRPGAYINVNTNGGVTAVVESNGVMTLPLPLNFGPNGVVEVNAKSDFTQFGYDLSHPKMELVREAFKRVDTILLYRMGSGGKSTITEGSLAITAKYGGTRGDAISVVSKANVNVTDAFDVETFLDGRSVDSQTVKNCEDLKSNRVVDFSGNGAVTAFSVALEGGTDTTPSVQDYMNYFTAIQVYDFNTMALPVSDDAVKTAAAEFVKRMRDEEGKKCQLVVAGLAADHEAVINVKNGVILADGTVIPAVKATAWVAAASAAAGVATSLTYSKYDGAVDVDQRYLSSDIIAALKAGELVFTEKRGEAVVEQDINSLVSITDQKNQEFQKNRTLRVLDDIANDSKRTFEDNFIGKVNNDQDGLELFKSDRISYFTALQAAGAITNFAAEDIDVSSGEAKDSIVMHAAIQTIDAMEKLYMTVQVV